MRYIDHFSARMTYPQFPDHPPRFGAEIPTFSISCVRDGNVVVPRVGQLQDPAMHHEPGEVQPAQKTQDTIWLPFAVTWLHKNPTRTKIIGRLAGGIGRCRSCDGPL